MILITNTVVVTFALSGILRIKNVPSEKTKVRTLYGDGSINGLRLAYGRETRTGTIANVTRRV